MSEYQYYEFQAVDRPLSEADRQTLRALSTRARITTTSFTNSYEWGDFKGDPAELMERWFDLHLYLANWGTRRLMIRLPRRLVDQRLLEVFLHKVECAALRRSGDNLILDIECDEEGPDEDWDDGSGWLAGLAPLRADVLAGDLRLFYLLWLTAVETDAVEADNPEPMPGIGPMTGALEACVDLLGLDPDLVQAAAERSTNASAAAPDAVRSAIAAMTDREKTEMLIGLFDRNPHVETELRAVVRGRLAPGTDISPIVARTAGELRSRAREISLARQRAEDEIDAAERRRQEQALEEARRMRLDEITRRGKSAWREIETEIERRNPASYDKAAGLLLDLQSVAEERGTLPDFRKRLDAIHDRHARKERFIERLAAIGWRGALG